MFLLVAGSQELLERVCAGQVVTVDQLKKETTYTLQLRLLSSGCFVPSHQTSSPFCPVVRGFP